MSPLPMPDLIVLRKQLADTVAWDGLYSLDKIARLDTPFRDVLLDKKDLHTPFSQGGNVFSPSP